MATALVEHGRIRTTLSKAKSLSQVADKLVGLSLRNGIASRRLIMYYLGDKAVKKLFSEIAPKFKDRKGGYTRVLKLGRRTSDGAEMAIVEFTS